MQFRTTREAQAFVSDAGFSWWQRFELVPGLFTPGRRDVGRVIERSQLPDPGGLTVLDIGTANGAACFELERQGAARVVGVDIYDDGAFGFRQTAEFLSSDAEFVQASVYDLPSVLDEQFDIVLFLDVICHLRHPLLALDQLHRLTRRYAVVESPICDTEAEPSSESVARFFPGAEYHGDFSNWFVPSARALVDWCESSGFAVTHRSYGRSGDSLLLGLQPVPGDPAFFTRGYERAVTVVTGTGG